MSFGGGGGDSGITTEINITPLCDIFVVLLIILMMTAESITNKGPEVVLPEIEQEVKNDAQVSVTLKSEKGVKSLWVNMTEAKGSTDDERQRELVRLLTAKLSDPALPNKHVIFCGDKGLLMREVESVMMKIHEGIMAAEASHPSVLPPGVKEYSPQISIKTSVQK